MSTLTRTPSHLQKNFKFFIKKYFDKVFTKKDIGNSIESFKKKNLFAAFLSATVTENTFT